MGLIFKYTNKVVLSALFFFMFNVDMALASGKVIKQKLCRVLIEGLENPKKGQSISISTADKKLAGKISAVSAKKIATADVLEEKECPDLANATVDFSDGSADEGAAKGKDSAAKKTKAGGDTPRKFGVSVLGGYTLMNLKLADGNIAEFQYVGIDAGLLLDYYLAISPTLRIPIGIGASYMQHSVPIASTSDSNNVTTYNRNVTMIFVRGETGMAFSLAKVWRVTATPFFDYGVSASHTITGNITDTIPIASSMRYGATVGLDFRFPFGLKIGADGTFFMGNLTLDAASASAYLPATTSCGFLGYGGYLRLGWDI